MASFFNNLGGRFGRQPARSPTSPNPPALPPSPQPQPAISPPPVQTMAAERSQSTDAIPTLQQQQPQQFQSQPPAKKTPFYFREENTALIVKGNFMTLAAKPEHVDRFEWLAHQVVEQYRLLEGMLKIIQEVDVRTGLPICNPSACPHMTAASNIIYTWLDNAKNPVRIPASQYITLVQRWILGKINDAKIFPTDTSLSSNSTSPFPSGQSSSLPSQSNAIGYTLTLSVPPSTGFPETFENDIKSLYRQMFRCYAHIYYAHWVEPFYHLSGTKELNTCFIHFVNVGKQFDLLADKDLAPMQPLVDMWLAKGLLPNPQPMQTDPVIPAAA